MRAVEWKEEYGDHMITARETGGWIAYKISPDTGSIPYDESGLVAAFEVKGQSEERIRLWVPRLKDMIDTFNSYVGRS